MLQPGADGIGDCHLHRDRYPYRDGGGYADRDIHGDTDRYANRDGDSDPERHANRDGDSGARPRWWKLRRHVALQRRSGLHRGDLYELPGSRPGGIE